MSEFAVDRPRPERLRRHPSVLRIYRVAVACVGLFTVALGIILMPLPGPGSLIAIAGVAILGTEFAAARRVSESIRRAIARVRERFAR